MEKDISIHEIADALNTSIATVSRALNNKPGVNKEMRKKVIKMAESLGYKPNILASGMRTQQLNILVIFPNRDASAKFYTELLYEGYLAGKTFFANHKVHFHLCYFEGTLEEHNLKTLEKLEELQEQDIRIDGVLVYYLGSERRVIEYLNRLKTKGAPIVALHKSLDGLNYSSLVTDQAYKIGALAAELMYKSTSFQQDILLIENSQDVLGKDDTSRGFKENIKSYYPGSNLIILDQFENNIAEKCIGILKRSSVTSCFATTARASVMLGKLLSDEAFNKHFFFIGSGRNKASEDSLISGTTQCIIDNNPYDEGFLGMQELFNLLIAKDKPAQYIEVPLRVYFKSNL